MQPCDSLNQSDVECATEDERVEYWETNDLEHQLSLLISYKQVDMKSDGELLKPAYKLVRPFLQDKKNQSYQIYLAQNEFLNRDDYFGFLSREPEPVNFLSVDKIDKHEWETEREAEFTATF